MREPTARRPFDTILIANRGEIARRITRTARTLGFRVVAVYSEADKDSLHVREADAAVCIGPAPAALSYLDIGRIINAARRTGAGAIHPGYGFLSENAEFAEACRTEGLVFIGPPAGAIRLMGDKAAAKQTMAAAGVPCVPGYHGKAQSPATLAREAERIGYPLMIKAAAGGGGHGIRRVERAEDLAAALASARAEAESAFGDGRLLLENLISNARHIEVQVLADAHGAVIHLGERDCSVQRRHQKLIEETPSPALDAAQRTAICEAAVIAARSIGYQNAGTVEFLFDPESGTFYFLEMNTRLQVEHPVTECVTGLDLVALQIAVAAGEPLPLSQEAVRFSGWAIEARVYAEDPARDFLPQTGCITLWQPPCGEGVRVDSGMETGTLVSAAYDPLLAKIITHDHTREKARRRLIAALSNTRLLGLSNNLPFLRAILGHETFAAGEATTAFLSQHGPALQPRTALPQAEELALAVAALLDMPLDDPLFGWSSRGGLEFPVELRCGDIELSVQAELRERVLHVRYEGQCVEIMLVARNGAMLTYETNGIRKTAAVVRAGPFVDLEVGHGARRFEDITLAPRVPQATESGEIRAPMAGVISAVKIAKGARVTTGEVLLVLEAMKMQNELAAPRDGAVAEVLVAAGQQVEPRQLLVRLEDPDAPGTEPEKKHG